MNSNDRTIHSSVQQLLDSKNQYLHHDSTNDYDINISPRVASLYNTIQYKISAHQ